MVQDSYSRGFRDFRQVKRGRNNDEWIMFIVSKKNGKTLSSDTWSVGFRNTYN